MVKLQILLLFCSSLYALTAPASQNLVLQIGESLRIKSPPSAQTWLSQGGIISVSGQGNWLLIQARRTGEVLLRTGRKLYRIQVTSSENKAHFTALKELLQSKQGLRAGFVGDHIQITGHLYRFKDFKDINFLARKRKFSYLFQAEIPVPLRPQVQTYIQEQIKEFLKASSFSMAWEKPLQIVVPKDHPLTEDQKIYFKTIWASSKPGFFSFIQTSLDGVKIAFGRK